MTTSTTFHKFSLNHNTKVTDKTMFEHIKNLP